MATATNFTPVNIEDRKKLEIVSGDTIRVWSKIQEKGKTRLQGFEGLVLARKHGKESGATITVRKVSNGIGVEKDFSHFTLHLSTLSKFSKSLDHDAQSFTMYEKRQLEISEER